MKYCAPTLALLFCLVTALASTSSLPPPHADREKSSLPPTGFDKRASSDIVKRVDREKSSLPPANFEPDDSTHPLFARQIRNPLPGPNLALWNGTEPSFINIKQVAVLDCWLAAASLAVVITSSNWMSHLFYFPNNTKPVGRFMPSTSEVTVTLWDPKTLTPHNLTARNPPTEVWTDGHYTEDNPGTPWWHSAIAVLLLGKKVPVTGILSNGTIDPRGGSAYQTLSVLTGYEATKKYMDDYTSVDEFYQDLVHGYWTPVVINTPSVVQETKPHQIGANHGYAVMFPIEYPNGTRSVMLRNPWGANEEYEINMLMRNTAGVGHLTNWNELKWPLQ